ncbi:MAG: extracellular solute-binding protein family 1 [Verrucomicrobiales bacterium]|nr:extracellular solute-binding protein family 1 [Verrucomicrobiales bacterium]
MHSRSYRILHPLFVLLPFLLFLGGCGEVIHNDSKPESHENVLSIKKSPVPISIKLLTRNGYFDPAVLQEFKEAYNIQVLVTYYETNVELYQKIAAGDYDLITPSGSLLQILIRDGRLARLDHHNLTNLTKLEHIFETIPFDPHHVFSAPYTWRTIGIGYNMSHETEIPFSWNNLFDPRLYPGANHQEFLGKLSLFDEARYSIGSALISLGFSPNSRKPDEIQKAADVLLKQRPYVSHFDDANAQKFLADEESFLSMAWSSDVSLSMKTNKKVRFSIPNEGALVFIDYLAIPKTSQKKDLAEDFIEFLLQPFVAGRISSYSHCASADQAARSYISREVINGAPYLLPDETKLFFLDIMDPATQALYEKTWDTIKKAKVTGPAL